MQRRNKKEAGWKRLRINWHIKHSKKKKKENRSGVPVPAFVRRRFPPQPDSGDSHKKNTRRRVFRYRFKLWQTIWLLLSLACLVVILVLNSYRSNVTASLTDQDVAQRWETDNRKAAQVSCFYRDGAQVTEETILQLNYNISKSLENASIKASDDGTGQFIWCASGMGNTTLSYKKNESTVTAIGVLGNFFDFHLFHYISGGPFVTDSGMRDQIIIDEYTAWKLFGSGNVVGQTVEIGGVNHLISGVIRRPSGKFVKEAGISDDTSICIMSYKSLLQYTSEGAAPSQDNSQDNGGSVNTGTDSQDSGESQNVGLLDVLENSLSVKAQASEIGTETASEAATETTAEQDSTSASTAQESADTAATASAGTESAAAATTKAAQENENTLPEGTGTQNTNYTDSGRISCYEAVMPEPVNGFAGSVVRQRAGNSSDVTVVVNSSRFGTVSLLDDLRGFAYRGMETSGYTFPYWENVARGWESVLSLVVLLQFILAAVPILFVIVMIIYYFRHKSWTAGSIYGRIKDRIYEKQSEKRYGKGGKAEGLSVLTDEQEQPQIPDNNKDNEDK